MSGRLQVLIAAVLFSTAGVVVKATVLTSWQVAGFRSAVAAVVLLLVARVHLRPTWRTLAVGLIIAVTFITFIVANKLTTSAHAVFLQAAAPLYLVLLGPWLLGERMHARDLPFLAVVSLGLVLLFAARWSRRPRHPIRCSATSWVRPVASPGRWCLPASVSSHVSRD